MIVRPKSFRIDPTSNLAKGLVFAGLGAHPGASTMFDSSLRRNNGALTNMDPASDWVFVPELGRWGLDNFDQNRERVIISRHPSINDVRPLTLVIWHRCNATGGRNILVGKEPYIVPYYSWIMGYWYGSWYFGVAGDTDLTVSFAAPPLSQWTCDVLTWDGGTDATGVSLHRNGRQLPQNTSQDGVNLYSDAAYDLEFGYDHPTDSWWGGIADPLIYNRALTPTEIADLADPSNVSLSGMLDWGRTRKRYFLPTSSSIIPHVMHYRRLMST